MRIHQYRKCMHNYKEHVLKMFCITVHVLSCINVTKFHVITSVIISSLDTFSRISNPDKIRSDMLHY